jgi:HSP20 family protein
MNNLIYPSGHHLGWSYVDNIGETLNGFLRTPVVRQSASMVRAPAVDISETDAAYLVKAELPGIRTEDLDITVKDAVLTIEAEHKENEVQAENGQFIRQERSYGKLVRSLQLGKNVDQESIAASHRDGVLRVTLPKAKVAQPRKVEVSQG